MNRMSAMRLGRRRVMVRSLTSEVASPVRRCAQRELSQPLTKATAMVTPRTNSDRYSRVDGRSSSALAAQRPGWRRTSRSSFIACSWRRSRRRDYARKAGALRLRLERLVGHGLALRLGLRRRGLLLRRGRALLLRCRRRRLAVAGLSALGVLRLV